MEFNVLDPRLKIAYFIPHLPQRLEDASPFGMYTLGLLHASPIISHVATMPVDIREPYASQKTVLLLRLKRLLWPRIAPIDIHALQQRAQMGLDSLFRVILTNTEEVAALVDQLKFADDIPYLHVSSVKGKGRLPDYDFTVDSLLKFTEYVLEHLSQKKEWTQFIDATKESIQPKDKRLPIPLSLGGSCHNVTSPNESALESFGWKLAKPSPLVSDPNHPPEPKKYIDRICLTADIVSQKREQLTTDMPDDITDNRYIIAVHSIHWAHYTNKNNLERNQTKDDIKAFELAYKNAIQQETYYDNIAKNKYYINLIKNKTFQATMDSRAGDKRCYTAGLNLLSSTTLTPVLRLEPKLNKIRGNLKTLAQCVRSGVKIRQQFKQSRLIRVAGDTMYNLIDNSFTERLNRYASTSNIQGLKLVSDLPLEIIPCNGVPLGLQYDVSRIPVLPGNLFLIHCIIPPIFVTHNSLRDILILRSFSYNDCLKYILERAIDICLEEVQKSSRDKIRIIDISTEEELVDALANFSGAILIFDGHGSYEGQYGVGTFVIGGKPIEIWSLRNKCTLPPIVIFSACDTHPIDGSHGSVANAVFTLGARTVLATSLPIDGLKAALFIGRLMLRIFDFIPAALETRDILTWREVISGMLRMTYTTEITRLLIKHEKIKLDKQAFDNIQLSANIAINNRNPEWFEVYLNSLSKESCLNIGALKMMISRWAAMTDAIKYIQLGSPENIVITDDI